MLRKKIRAKVYNSSSGRSQCRPTKSRGKREAETKLDITPPNSKPCQQKFKSKEVKTCTPIYTTMTTLSLCTFFQKKPRNVRMQTLTSANMDRQWHVPFDLVIEHKERWYFPKEGDWNNKVPTNKEGKQYYHPNLQKCLKPRFPLRNIPLHQSSRGNYW